MKRIAALALATSAWAALPAGAQTVYRCGPQQNTYSQTPCPEGRAVEVGDGRTPAQRAAGEALARDAKIRGQQLEQERLALEAMEPPGAGSVSPRAVPAAPAASTPKAKASRPKKRSKRHEGADFRAIAPPPRKPVHRP